MPKVTFRPGEIMVEVAAGDSLLEAARQAGIDIDAPCGGRGTCGRCRVQVLSGTVETSVPVTDKKLREDGWVLICCAKAMDSDLVISTFYDAEAEQGKFSDQPRDLDSIDPTLLPTDKTGFLSRTVTISVAEPSAGDGLSDLDRFSAAMMKQPDIDDVTLSITAMRELPLALRENGGQASVVYFMDDSRAQITNITSDAAAKRYGVAVDIGTTTVAVSLVDADGSILGVKTGYNAQVACGLDVISRINYAGKPQRLAELREKILGSIASITAALCDVHGVAQTQIMSASVAANTVMVHLLLGIPPEYIRLDPYVPAVYALPLLRAGEIGLPLHPDAPVYIAPSVGSYVGGDITSGILCTSLCTDSEALCLFIDIGTNGEIVLGSGEFLISCACSAGPAFEGGGIKCGMRASNGAIERVSIDADTGLPMLKVIGDCQPRGICGSGMISLVAELLRKGLLDPSGKFSQKPCDAVVDKRYVLFDQETDDEHIVISVGESDIANIIRAKAAIFSACRTMLASLCLEFGDVERIYISGGFGRYLDIDDAKTIGLVPNLPRESFEFIGNTSLLGAYMTLVSPEHRAREAETAQRMTYIDLSTEPSYMDEYMGALFLPHTDMRLFE